MDRFGVRGGKIESFIFCKFYAWISRETTNHDLKPNGGLDKKVVENRLQLQLFSPSIPKASNRDPTAHNYFMLMKDIFLRKWQNIHNSDNIGLFTGLEVCNGMYVQEEFWILVCHTLSHILSHTFTHKIKISEKSIRS